MFHLVRQLTLFAALAAFLLGSPWTGFRNATPDSQSEEQRSENDEEANASVALERLSLAASKSGARARRRHESRDPVANLQTPRTATHASWARPRLAHWHPSLALRLLVPRRVAPGDDDPAPPLTRTA